MGAAIGARRVEPEWLDTLPALDPRALRSRRDLARVNALMGNARLVARELARHLASGPCSLAEIGAGDGAFALALARSRRLRGRSAEVTLVDRQPCAGRANLAALGERGWRARVVQADVFAWLAEPGAPRCDAIVANLFLHHFDATALARMLALAARRARLFVACEPRRSALALAGASLLGAVGCNDVTRHDAAVSVRAGFAGHEIGALWPDDGAWRIEEGARGFFSHVFVARRA
jgi:hypothetical protein